MFLYPPVKEIARLERQALDLIAKSAEATLKNDAASQAVKVASKEATEAASQAGKNMLKNIVVGGTVGGVIGVGAAVAIDLLTNVEEAH
jgi:capsular polysaccharide biosynthesis protein